MSGKIQEKPNNEALLSSASDSMREEEECVTIECEIGELEALRRRIDSIDAGLAELFRERMRVCEKIGAYKRIHSLPIENPEREKAILAVRAGDECGFGRETASFFQSVFDTSKSLQRSRLNLYLVGMPGSGKTRLGRALSTVLGRPFVDTDKLVTTKQGISIDAIFDRYGEDRFRELEHDALIRAAADGGAVVATGGGILTYTPNIELLKYSGKIVFLDRKLEYLLHAKTRNRPLLRRGSEAIKKLYYERYETYARLCDFSIDPDRRSSIRRIAKFFNSALEQD